MLTDRNFRLFLGSVLLATMIFGFQNCGAYNFSAKVSHPTTSKALTNGPTQITDQGNGPCSPVTDHFREPDSQITNKVDILFILHTTDSFARTTYQDVASGLTKFASRLPAEADYQIAVMPAF